MSNFAVLDGGTFGLFLIKNMIGPAVTVIYTACQNRKVYNSSKVSSSMKNIGNMNPITLPIGPDNAPMVVAVAHSRSPNQMPALFDGACIMNG